MMLHDLFFSRKAKAYRRIVFNLLPELGLDTSVFGLLSPRDTMVEQLRLQGFTAHEAALAIGYGSLAGFAAKSGPLVAEELSTVLGRARDAWIGLGHVDAARTSGWREKAIEQLRLE